jgi:hypothetical protein
MSCLYKRLSAPAGLVSDHQNDRAVTQIKGKRRPPFATGNGKAQLFHVGVFGPVERVDTRAAF